jgi:hypothetical protein
LPGEPPGVEVQFSASGGFGMPDSRQRRVKEVENAIRGILLHEWDPIGTAGIWPDSEYKPYVAKVFRILAGNRSEQELVEFLYRTGRDAIGLYDKSREQLRPVARRLLEIDVKL